MTNNLTDLIFDDSFYLCPRLTSKLESRALKVWFSELSVWVVLKY